MPAAELTAGQVMNIAASLLNDASRSVYTYAVQLPYLQLAIQELQERFELHNIPVTEKSSAVIQVDAGEDEISYGGTPALPEDMVEPLQLWERPRDTDPWVPMTKRDFLPHNLEGVEISQFIYYVWQDQKILLLPANADNDIKIDYTKELFGEIADEDTEINIINARSYLEYKTAALVAKFVENNDARHDSLVISAEMAIDRAMGIGVKGKQNIFSRRRPFRSNYKRRGWLG